MQGSCPVLGHLVTFIQGAILLQKDSGHKIPDVTPLHVRFSRELTYANCSMRNLGFLGEPKAAVSRVHKFYTRGRMRANLKKAMHYYVDIPNDNNSTRRS